MLHAATLRSGTFRPVGTRNHARDLGCMFHGCFGQVTSGAGNTNTPVFSKRLRMSSDWLGVFVVVAS